MHPYNRNKQNSKHIVATKSAEEENNWTHKWKVPEELTILHTEEKGPPFWTKIAIAHQCLLRSNCLKPFRVKKNSNCLKHPRLELWSFTSQKSVWSEQPSTRTSGFSTRIYIMLQRLLSSVWVGVVACWNLFDSEGLYENSAVSSPYCFEVAAKRTRKWWIIIKCRNPKHLSMKWFKQITPFPASVCSMHHSCLDADLELQQQGLQLQVPACLSMADGCWMTLMSRTLRRCHSLLACLPLL